MQAAQERFREHGIGVAAVSYDSPAILRDFAERRHIAFPLLSDPESRVISSFGVLDNSAEGMERGMAHPGFVYIDHSGMLREKFFAGDVADRYTANNALSRLFPELLEGASAAQSGPHIQYRTVQSDRVVAPGSRMTLGVEITLPAKVHVYAPNHDGYRAVAVKLSSSDAVTAQQQEYPPPQMLYLPAIHQSAPVYEREVVIRQDAVVSDAPQFVHSLGQGKALRITGELEYQACDDKVCYAPQRVPVSWEIQVRPLDRMRSPEALQHKSPLR